MKTLVLVPLFFSFSSLAAVKPQQATFALGCFWSAQTSFSELRGVSKVVAGYSGGLKTKPSYDDVSGGKTGHAETVDIVFDPDKIRYSDLVDVFFSIHDPTTLNRQGADVGTQYRSIIFYHNDAQRKVAEEQRKKFSAKFKNPIVTEIIPYKAFWPAEAYHQFYFAAHPNEPYCKEVVAGKVAKFRTDFKDKLK